MFNWSLIALHCCVAWFLPYNVNQPKAHMCPFSFSHLPTLHSPAHLSKFSQSSRLRRLLHSNFLLAVCFIPRNVHISMLLSQFTPLFPSPSVPQVHSPHVHPSSCPANRLVSIIFLDSTHNDLIHDVCFFFLTHFTLYNGF